MIELNIMKNIVIIGAGFGGLSVALNLGKNLKQYNLQNHYRLFLVDKNSYQTYTPTLYEAATTSKETANYLDLKEIMAYPVKDLIAKLPIIFIQDKVLELDLFNGDVHCQNQKLKFDYLVLAMGSEPNFYDISGLEKYAMTFKTFLDAIKLRDRILELYLEKSASKQDFKIAIGGGGPTSVELAGEIQEWLFSLKQEIKQECSTAVTMIQGGDTILPGLDKRVIKKAVERLKKLKVCVLTNARVIEVQEKKVLLDSKKEISYDIFVWTGGVKASALISVLPLKKDRSKVLVAEEMECLPQTPDLKLYGNIYGLGDAVCFYNPQTNLPVPMTARSAIIQGGVVAKNIFEDIKLKEKIIKNKKSFIYEPYDYPYVTPIGGKYAIAKIGPFVVSGFLGWLFKGLVELNYLLSIRPFFCAIRLWLKGLKIFIKNDRLG